MLLSRPLDRKEMKTNRNSWLIQKSCLANLFGKEHKFLGKVGEFCILFEFSAALGDRGTKREQSRSAQDDRLALAQTHDPPVAPANIQT